MSVKPLFSGLIVDENDRPVEVTYVGDDPFYVVDDAGFHRHIPTEDVDRQVLNFMRTQIEGNEGLIAEQAVKALGQDDIFSRAILERQLKQVDQQFDQLLQTGIPEEGRAYLGMMGFRVVINFHGAIIRLEQRGAAPGSDEGE